MVGQVHFDDLKFTLVANGGWDFLNQHHRVPSYHPIRIISQRAILETDRSFDPIQTFPYANQYCVRVWVALIELRSIRDVFTD